MIVVSDCSIPIYAPASEPQSDGVSLFAVIPKSIEPISDIVSEPPVSCTILFIAANVISASFVWVVPPTSLVTSKSLIDLEDDSYITLPLFEMTIFSSPETYAEAYPGSLSPLVSTDASV